MAAHHLRPERSDHTLQATALVHETYLDLVALDDALTSLSAMDPQKSRIVELRFFGGLTVDETAEVLGVSPVTVYRAWAFCGKRLL